MLTNGLPKTNTKTPMPKVKEPKGSMTENTKKAMEQIKAVYDDQKMTINGRDYVFTSTTHAKRKKIFAFLSDIESLLSSGNFSWMDGQRFDGIEETLGNMILFEDMQIAKLKDHWEKYPGDYLKYIVTALQVVSFPFMAGSL